MHVKRELRSLLLSWDPIGIVGPDGPSDEYDCLLRVLGFLRQGMSEAELEGFLVTELRDHFGIDPESARPRDFASRIHHGYWSDPLPGSQSPSS
jgi:hypothetical protein